MPLQPADFALASQLLDQAMDLSPADAEDWLDALPAEHAHLRDSLRSMLAARGSQTQGRFLLDTFPHLADSDAADGLAAGDMIGPYRLVREIGRGGMGLVWLAARADGNFERQLALKLPRLAWTEGLAARMAREKRIAALLEHASIARMYDAGVDAQGRPYIAMEYIDGKPIDAYCRDNGLDTAARVRLFIQVVRAVAHAHGRLVIHRDLKPANVLVDAQGDAHLLDFGIAKLMDDAAGENLTLEQGRVLTPSYAAPEQIAGLAVGVETDVYALGVLLYELLTGQLPFQPKRRSLGAIEDAILQGDAPLASSRAADRVLAKRLRGDLDAILVKAMRRDPTERYSTAAALATDLEHHLAGEAISARPDSTWRHLRRAVSRHRVIVGATAAVVAVAFAGAAAVTLQSYRAARQSERARAATELVTEMLQASGRTGSAEQSLAETNGLDRAAGLIETKFAGQPDLQADLYGVVSRAYEDIGAPKLAVQYALRQVQTLERLPTERPRRVHALLALAQASMAEGWDADAQARAEEALNVAGSDTMLAAECQAILARIFVEVGKLDEAKSHISAAAEALLASGARATVATAWLFSAKAELLFLSNQFVESQIPFDSAVEMAIRAEGQLSRAATRLQINRSRQLLNVGRFQSAQEQFNAAIKRLNASRTSVDTLRANVLTAQFWSRAYVVAEAPHQTAAPFVSHSRELLRQLGSRIPPTVRAEVEFAWAEIASKLGSIADTDTFVAFDLPVLEASTDRLSRKYHFSVVRGNLAAVRGEHGLADIHLLRAIEYRRNMGQATHPYTAPDWSALVMNRVMRGDLSSAAEAIDKAPIFGADAANGVDFQIALNYASGALWLVKGDANRALKELPSRPFPLEWTDDNNPLIPLNGLNGEALCKLGKWDEGLEILMGSIKSLLQYSGPNHPTIARLHAVAGRCALGRGDRAGAIALARTARAAFDISSPVSSWYTQPLLTLESELGLQARPQPRTGKAVRRLAA